MPTNLRAIPTVYAGIEFKSRFEANVARLLDAVNLRWEYEPQSFLIDTPPSGAVHYQPDFYVCGMGLWIETRGYVTTKGQRQISGFAGLIRRGEILPRRDGDLSLTQGESDPSYLVIHGAEMGFHERGGCSDSIYLVSCWSCRCGSFIGAALRMSCRICGANSSDASHLSDVWELTVDRGQVYYGDRPAADAVLDR